MGVLWGLLEFTFEAEAILRLKQPTAHSIRGIGIGFSDQSAYKFNGKTSRVHRPQPFEVYVVCINVPVKYSTLKQLASAAVLPQFPWRRIVDCSGNQ